MDFPVHPREVAELLANARASVEHASQQSQRAGILTCKSEINSCINDMLTCANSWMLPTMRSPGSDAKDVQDHLRKISPAVKTAGAPKAPSPSAPTPKDARSPPSLPSFAVYAPPGVKGGDDSPLKGKEKKGTPLTKEQKVSVKLEIGPTCDCRGCEAATYNHSAERVQRFEDAFAHERPPKVGPPVIKPVEYADVDKACHSIVDTHHLPEASVEICSPDVPQLMPCTLSRMTLLITCTCLVG